MTIVSAKDLIRPIAHLNGVKPPAPGWFDKAVETPSEEGSINVHGAKITYSAWGKVGRPGLLFVHGGRAHRNWWRPFAPFFCENHRVAALDLSGMGDSEWRDQYSVDRLVDEIFGVIEAAKLNQFGRPLIVGHSFGGWMTLACVEREGDRLGGAVVIDSPLGKPDPDEGYTVVKRDNKTKPGAENGRMRIYPTIEEPVARFRFLPNQPAENHFLIDYLAREGLRRVTSDEGGEGWTWKFDPHKGKNFDIAFKRDLLRTSRCPLAFIYGENSLFARGDTLDHLRDQARGRSPFILMPDSYHHLMMDQPIAFITTLRMLFACWPVQVGR